MRREKPVHARMINRDLSLKTGLIYLPEIKLGK